MTSKIKNTGFTLIEVLIAMLVLAVGLLGLAGLQAKSLKNNQRAYNRSQATQLAYDIADRMRANKGAAASYLGAAAANANCLTTTGCSAIEMAKNDLFEWNAAIAQALPSGTGSITLAGNIYTLTINWDDNRDGNVDANDPSFKTSFQL